jgi:hypothetical protein
VSDRKPPNAGKGRKKGSVNKTTAMLKEAILGAATETGSDGNGKDGLMGYCAFLAKTEPKAFSTLLGRVLPMQVTGEDGGPIKVTQVQLVALADGDGADSSSA